MFHYSPIPKESQERQKCYFFEDYVKVLYKSPQNEFPHCEPTWVTERFKDYAETIKNFSVRKDDVWVVSFPKTGTTLTAEMVTLLLSDLDYEQIEQRDIIERVYFLELCALSKYSPDNITRAASDSSRRIMKTHLQMNLMPQEVLRNGDHKVIYVVRDPRDAAVSWFHHYKNIHGYGGSPEAFFADYLTGEMVFGSYFRHVEEFSPLARELDNFLLIRYEDILSDSSTTIKKVASFLNKPLSDKDVQSVADYLKFDRMKERKNSNMAAITEFLKKSGDIQSDFRFMRKGKVGSFKEEMSSEYVAKFDAEVKKWKEVQKLYPN